VLFFTGSPLLSGIRYDDKSQTVTVSSKAELNLPADKAGVRDHMLMSYRFDATVTNAGCVLVVRDITYQNARREAGSFFPKIYTAEETITDQALSVKSDEGELKSNLRKETLRMLNKLYAITQSKNEDLSKLDNIALMIGSYRMIGRLP